MKKPIYLFSDKIKWKAFESVMKKFPDVGIMPMNINRILWELLKDKRLYIYLDNESDDPICLALKIPTNKIINIIK